VHFPNTILKKEMPLLYFQEIFWIFLGLLGLWFGSDLAVDAAKKIAAKLGISDLIVGLTIASIGTSLPEIFTNVMAGIKISQGIDPLASSGIAIGNIIGSNLGQITIILGIVGFIATLELTKKSLRRDGLMMLLALFLMYFAAMDGYVSRIEGIFLALVYVLYIIILIKQEKIVSKVRTKSRGEKSGILINCLLSLVGLIIVIIAADLIISNGINLTKDMHISSSLIGIFVGLGTSLPELSVSIKAVMRKSGRLSLGNLIGSNITDPLFSFGLGASIAGVTVTQEVLQFDFVFWMISTLIALLLLFNHLNINRKESSILILLYAMFIYFRIMFFA
jgi:cation:H+ antiporter